MRPGRKLASVRGRSNLSWLGLTALLALCAAIGFNPASVQATASIATVPATIVETSAPVETTPPPTETLKLVQDPSTRLTLLVKVNGKGPFPFLVDTGSDRTVISRELASTLNLAAGPVVRMHQTSGVDTVKTVVIDRLTIGRREIRNIEAPALGARDLGAAGMLGVDALRDLHVVMDFETMRLSSSPSRAEPFDPNTIVVHGRSRFGQLILVNAAIGGVPIFVVLDSGSQLSVGNPALRKLLTGRDTTPDTHTTVDLITVTGRKLTVDLQTIAEANVGGIAIHHMPLAFAALQIFDRFDLSQKPAMLLGMDVLSRCRRVSVDLHRREATFTLN